MIRIVKLSRPHVSPAGDAHVVASCLDWKGDLEWPLTAELSAIVAAGSVAYVAYCEETGEMERVSTEAVEATRAAAANAAAYDGEEESRRVGSVIYNDNDAVAAAWLGRLVDTGRIPPGVVTTTPIEELQPDDCHETSHFFAGIGGWPLALEIAGWPDDAPVWTGSCPCQPFSNAGKRAGTDDPRHLWPAFARLIGECRPPVVFGEQVASADGREWLAGVRSDLEALGYAVGAADLCSAGVGAPHIRQRLYWALKGWATPRANDGTGDTIPPGRQGGLALKSTVTLAGWPTPTSRDAKNSHGDGSNPRDLPRKTTLIGWPLNEAALNGPYAILADPGGWPFAVTINGDAYRLNPRFSLWLMGYPDGWGMLKGAGNAIDPYVAAAFVRAFMEAG